MPKQIAEMPKTVLALGPNKELRSHQNPFRHGLTAETVITIIENAADYTAFEKIIIADYKPRTAVEHRRTVSLSALGLRRAVAIELGLFQIQGQIIRDRQSNNHQERSNDPLKVFRNLLVHDKPDHNEKHVMPNMTASPKCEKEAPSPFCPSLDVARCFLGVANLSGIILERIGRYEVTFWRQVAQTVLILNSFRKARYQQHQHLQLQLF